MFFTLVEVARKKGASKSISWITNVLEQLSTSLGMLQVQAMKPSLVVEQAQTMMPSLGMKQVQTVIDHNFLKKQLQLLWL